MRTTISNLARWIKLNIKINTPQVKKYSNSKSIQFDL